MQFRLSRAAARLALHVAPIALAALTLAGPVGAQPTAAPRAGAAPAAAAPANSAITPYVDESTLMVARIDPASVDWEAWGNWLADLLKAAKRPQQDVDVFTAEMRKQLPLVKKWTADFTRAGGKSVYVIGRMSKEAPFYAMVPLGAGADAKALGELLKDPLNMQAAKAAGAGAAPGAPQGAGPADGPLAGMKAEVVGSALYFGPDAALEDVKTFMPAARPELEQAFANTSGAAGGAAAAAAGGGAPIRIAFNPTEGLRGVMVLSMKQLPDQLGGGPVAPVANGLRWVSLSVRTPTPAAKPSLQLTVQAKDAPAAKTLSGVVDAAHKKAAEAQQAGAGAGGAAGPAKAPVDWLFETLAPRIAADKPDQLRLSLDEARLKDLVARLVPALDAAREQAVGAQSRHNEVQIGVAVVMYANEHAGQLPKNLPADLRPYFNEQRFRDTFANPSRPEAEAGYMYAAPADKITLVQNPSETPILWESFDKWGEGVNVAFVDGHVERVTDKSEFDKLLKNNPNAVKAQPVKVGPAKAAPAGAGTAPGGQ